MSFNLNARNHLRRYRKASGLTQLDFVTLLDLPGNNYLCRAENSLGCPNFETALAYELILGCPVSKLYPEHTRTLHSKIQKRLPDLIDLLSQQKQTRKINTRINKLQNTLTRLNAYDRK